VPVANCARSCASGSTRSFTFRFRRVDDYATELRVERALKDGRLPGGFPRFNPTRALAQGRAGSRQHLPVAVRQVVLPA
jgi:hypothetical protein